MERYFSQEIHTETFRLLKNYLNGLLHLCQHFMVLFHSFLINFPKQCMMLISLVIQPLNGDIFNFLGKG